MILQMQQCALIQILIMHLYTGNVYCSDVPTVLVLTFLTKKQQKKEETTPSIRFHIYHIIGSCTAHGRIPLKDKKICYMCEQ